MFPIKTFWWEESLLRSLVWCSLLALKTISALMSVVDKAVFLRNSLFVQLNLQIVQIYQRLIFLSCWASVACPLMLVVCIMMVLVTPSCRPLFNFTTNFVVTVNETLLNHLQKVC